MAAPNDKLLADQIRELDWVDRGAGGRIVAIFHDSKLKIQRLDSDREEQRIAQFNDGSQLRGEIVLSRGRLSSIEYSAPPPVAAAGPIQVRVYELKPAQPVAPRQSVVGLGDVTNVLRPADKQERADFLGRIGSVPPDLAELLSLSNGFDLGEWHYSGTASRRLFGPGLTMWALAESGPRALVLCDNTSPVLGLFEGEAEELTPLTTVSVFEALRNLRSQLSGNH